MEDNKIEIGTIVTMKKGHPCGANEWEVVRVGADMKLKWNNCNSIVMMTKIEFKKKIKKIVK